MARRRFRLVRLRNFGSHEEEQRTDADRTMEAALEFAVSSEEAIGSGRCGDAWEFAFEMNEEIGVLRGRLMRAVDDVREGRKPSEKFEELRELLDLAQGRRQGLLKRLRTCPPGRGRVHAPASSTFTLQPTEEEDDDE